MAVRYDIEAKVALITGAAAGIGRAIALRLAEEGVFLALSDVNLIDLEKTGELVRATPNAPAPLLQTVDVADETQVTTWVEATLARFGRVDILVNNAGIFPRRYLLEMTGQEWDAVLDINLKGLFYCARAAARLMVEKGQGGRIITLSSSSGFEGTARGVHYSASKAGQIGFIKALALELAAHQITVNAVAPGITDTAQPRYGLTEAQIAERAQNIPLRRIGQPEDIAEAVAWLCSPAASYITGQTLHINGGSLRY
jgi:3-oxoacyl-[acyl-carrier protein] reductase